MSNDELIAKAVELLRDIQTRAPEHTIGIAVDDLPNRRIRDAVVIDFHGDEHQGKIQVTLERDTGAVIGSWHTPPKGATDVIFPA